MPILERVDSEQRPGFRLTPRDRQIVQAVCEYRVLTTPLIQALFFPSADPAQPNSRCQLRLQKLYQHGYLLRDEQPTRLSDGRRPLLYFLDVKGAELVAEMLDLELAELDWRPREYAVSWPFLEHLLATNAVRVAITLASQAACLTLTTWHDEKQLKKHADYVTLTGPQGGKQRAAVVPDGYFVLEKGDGVHTASHFLELDRCTVTGKASLSTRRDWARKVKAYLQYYRSGLYQKRYQTRSLRVLTVTGPRRLANLKAITEEAQGGARFWFTTFELAADPHQVLSSPIWQVAGRKEPAALI